MKISNSILVPILVFVILQACSTGQSAFRNGKYYDATIQSVNNLRLNPDSKKSIEVIQKSYPMALEYYRQKIDQFTGSNSIDKYLEIVAYYELLNKMADEINRCPAALAEVRPVVYFNDQLQKAEELAIQEQFDNALRLLENENIDEAKMAFKRLLWVKERQPGFSDIERQLIIAKDLATLKVVVEYLPEIHSNYRINSKVFYYRLFDELEKNAGNDFIRFYKPALAEELQIRPHKIITVQFVEFNIGTMFEREHTNAYQLDSVVVGSYTDDNGKEHEVTGTVNAEATLFEREVQAKGILQLAIKDYKTDETIQARKFPGEYIWQNAWATYNGDRRALPSQVFQLTKEKQRFPPDAQEMFLLFSNPLFPTATTYLQSYFKRP